MLFDPVQAGLLSVGGLLTSRWEGRRVGRWANETRCRQRIFPLRTPIPAAELEGF